MRQPGSASSTGLLDRFQSTIDHRDPIGWLASDLVGAKAVVDGPFGARPLVYADYVASGRALRGIESFVLDDVLPYYANSHTEASYCGGMMTRLRREARARIAACCGANENHAVIFCGSGATAGINRLVALLGVGKRSRVVLGPYEHHSNILPWRESGAEVIEIAEAPSGGPDMRALLAALAAPDADRVICSLSAASNVTGILTDVEAVTRAVKASGAAMIWDYACAGPYVPISMGKPGAEIDAIVVSPHKFIGGPGASGILIVRRDAVVSRRPTWPGGGTVKFVSPTEHDFSDSIETREEAGTPNVIGDIRSALAFIAKDAIDVEEAADRSRTLVARALAVWSSHPRIQLLGSLTASRLPIFSFRIRDGMGGFVHQQLVTRMLSDRFGIQARGGCACAGPYAHRLLGIDVETSDRMRHSILDGDEMEKLGFVRLNLSVLMPDDKVDFILESVAQLASDAGDYVPLYDFDPGRAIFFPKAA